MLAKQEKELFIRLVSHAKRLANANTVLVVFVSSEGSILPIMKSLSAVNRSTKPFDITDITDKEAVSFLSSNGLSEKLSSWWTTFSQQKVCSRGSCVVVHSHS